ncbi:DUF192 domain-containing protein [Halobacteriales archaeon QH_7_65_31]|nr:MAG: DUF192 domain-containing protein [Halobacteriales archaeon QH_7_65_31]
MEIVHQESGEPLATTVEIADTRLARARGLMFQRSISDDDALVLSYDGQSTRQLHMLFVPFDIDAIWLADGVVQATKRLPAWIGHGRAVADTVVELPAGTADDVEPGDHVRLAQTGQSRSSHVQ